MSALMIIQAQVMKKAPYKAYQEGVKPVIESFGGRYKASGVGLEVLEGSHDGRRLIVFEFPSVEHIRRFWESPAYAAVKPLRFGAAKIDVWAVPGA
jgi:uncharacterized protein (DUF1330 family)